MNILFVTWDGPQTTYIEGLFLPIFSRLSGNGMTFHVLQFTWADRAHCEKIKVICEAQGVTYRRVGIWRKPVALGSLFSALWGHRKVIKAIRELNIDVVMPRAPLPALVVLRALGSLSTCSLVYDADGLPLDERVDFGQWSKRSVSYRLLRIVEARVIRRADAVLTRSRKAIDILLSRAGSTCEPEKFHVVVNGRDESQFKLFEDTERLSVRQELNTEIGAPLIIYAGSIGPQYCGHEMFHFFKYVRDRRQDARFVILTPSVEMVNELLHEYEDLRQSVQVSSVSPKDVPKYLAAADLGLALRKPSFSMQAVAPIKIGEYLLCGLPVLATRGIGDTDSILTDKVGLQLETMSDVELEDAADWFLGKVLPEANKSRDCCREFGMKYFSLEASIKSHLKALSSLQSKES